MQDPPGDELRALRERAYGPSADIDGDPAALERLRELEAAASVAVAAGATSPAVAGTESPRGTVVPPTASEETPAGPSNAQGPPTTDDARAADDVEVDVDAGVAVRRRRPVVVSAIALVVALLVGAAVAYGVLQLRPGSVATLAAAPDAAWPEFLGERQDGSTVFEEFLGLTVAIVPQPWGREDDVPCLFVLHATGSAAITTVGCGAGGFAPTAALAVTPALPDALIAEYPVGTALQFVLEDGKVVVYADRADGTP